MCKFSLDSVIMLVLTIYSDGVSLLIVEGFPTLGDVEILRWCEGRGAAATDRLETWAGRSRAKVLVSVN